MDQPSRKSARIRTTSDPAFAGGWRSPAVMLMVMAAAMQLSFATWWTLLNNFAIDEISFTGREIGIQQSLREIPGFLAFTAVFVLLVLREQTLALVSLLLLALGVAATGYFPTTIGLYATTVLMSIGFHYYETMAQSLSLQWLPRVSAARWMGRILSVAALAQLVTYGFIFLVWKTFDVSYRSVFTTAALATALVVAFLWLAYPQFREEIPQRKHLVLRRRYWLYYALTFMSGARRQIFTVFAGFLMVERFGYQVHEISALFLINCLVNILFAPLAGQLIGRIGERRALTLEYFGLICIFAGYAVVADPRIAAILYVLDHAFFALAIALKTYFQKIADPADIAPTAGVAFTINHIAAIVIPATFGLIWLASPAAVFLIGAAMAAASLVLARLVPLRPAIGRETLRTP